MKKNLFVMSLWLLLGAAASAQGVSRLFGLVGGSPQANQSTNGFLFSTDSSGNNLQLQYNFPVTTFGAAPGNMEMAPFNGKLYGTTINGGENNYGTIFEYDPATNVYTKKFDFGPNVNLTGGHPRGSLLLYNGKFYGTASSYGVSGAGCIFEWDPVTNVYTKRYDFDGSAGGAPHNSLRLLNGKMYGTTQQGGSSNLGVVFEWDPASNVATKLYELTGPNGWGFYNNVTVYNNKLYCGSHQGGANNYGALYVIDPSLPYGSNTTIIKHFDQVSGGTTNSNEMIVYNNKLYGCLNQAGTNSAGTLFEVDPATNTFTKLADFNHSTTGAQPLGKLVLNGSKFLGLCAGGGVNGSGTVFEWDPASPNTIVLRQSFGVNNFDNPAGPNGTLSFYNGKYYSTTYNGGFTNNGNLFEYNYTDNTISKKLTFNAAENGRTPLGRPTLLNGKLYGICYQGPQEIFGTPYGCLWSFDPATSTYTRRFLFNAVNNAGNGRAPISAPMGYNNKLYGTTQNGGASDWGVIYEFDPATDGYVKTDFQPTGGAFPIGEPTLYNSKLYGMTNAGGIGNNGIIYSYDPSNATVTKLFDVQNSGSNTPNGGFAVFNNKLYGATGSGGANNVGAIIAYDPATNNATTVYSLSGATGFGISNVMTLYNNVFYGTALSGGLNGRGCIFKFDPATNNYTVLYHFDPSGSNGYDPKGEITVSGNKLYCITQGGNALVKVIELDPTSGTVTTKSNYAVTTGNLPSTHNGLTVVPAFIANGIANSCETYPTITIDATNTNKWVPVLNNSGDVVAEIKANGNLLGNVSVSTYINNGAVREDPSKRLYMDRNITITPQNNTIATPVDIRLYVKTSEFLALKNALNSQGQPSGINTINDVAIFKNEQSCGSGLTSNAIKQSTTAENYEYGYVLKTSVNSFSTFYFASSAFSLLPVRLLSFAGSACNMKSCLLWTVENETNFSRYEVEKSSDGANFSFMVAVAAKNTGTRDNYTATDLNPSGGVNYYRLKMIDRDGRLTYSQVIKINFSRPELVSIQPNPASDFIIVKGLKGYQQLKITDITGKVLLRQAVQNSIQQVDIASLAKGIYFLSVEKDGASTNIKLVKQ